MSQLKTDPFPTLHTERLVLREITMHDVEAVFAIRSDERVMQYIGKPRAKEIKDSVELIARLKKGREDSSSITWGITTKNDPTLIGMIGYHRIQPEHYRGEIGYTLHADHWRKGIMSEAMKAVVAHGFGGLGFHSIEARTDPKNSASNALLLSNGFVREGLFKENYYWNGEFLDSAVYSKLASEN
ncbi:MAG: GNAT family N-acetyltransferase [Flavobacteriales bacterium]|nr:GNAT family N-acetyltransferase [Flavobacteriales bacterium]MBK7296177.1 GNAT family N-acetyltransferase [Flavobacteriales bacterium]MBK9534740.1 GNAT family N-acetyltransferase [Flavobacteriales bacterium]MBP9140010.1 GNAT family N-acetyltransferase [Flavobacteriales bacterium]HQV53647.1 GNAT family protein [Flavobacteriales bacterium]